MDPDAALFQLRELLENFNQQLNLDVETNAASEALHTAGHELWCAVTDLDEWLTKGGFAPREWTTVNTPSQEVSPT